MKSLIIHSAKDLRIDEISEPLQNENEILIEVASGGICGSDLHYFNQGGFGTVRLKEPMTLGHEVSGFVRKIGSEVETDQFDFRVGDLVAVSPSRPCGTCQYCAKAAYNHCLNMRFYGSAMPFPHIQGAFSQYISVTPQQCINATGLTTGLAALAEPFAVVLHAVKISGNLLGKNVLIMGAGPIGLLAAFAARRAGATAICAVDIADSALEKAKFIGVDETLNPTVDQPTIKNYGQNKGRFDILFECSGAEAALRSGIDMLKPMGTIVQLGLGGDMSLPVMAITAKELQLKGSFRFHEEFALAVELMQKGLVDLTPLISHTLPFEDALGAFEIANDRSVATKVQIDFQAGS